VQRFYFSEDGRSFRAIPAVRSSTSLLAQTDTRFNGTISTFLLHFNGSFLRNPGLPALFHTLTQKHTSILRSEIS